jgi:hypothetical protein
MKNGAGFRPPEGWVGKPPPFALLQLFVLLLLLAAGGVVSGDAVAHLERRANVNSGTLNPGGVRALAEMLRPEYGALGFTVYPVTTPPRKPPRDCGDRRY